MGMTQHNSLPDRLPGTGEWLLKYGLFRAWLNDGGLIWLRGRAGCGKSMLMDFVVKEHTRKDPTHKSLSFVFQRNYGKMKCSQLGLFQSLLHQLLKHRPASLATFMQSSDFAKRCEIEGPPGEKWSWSLQEIRYAFTTALDTEMTHVPVGIYLDAVDEAGEEAATDILRFCFDIASSKKPHLSVCFSSRPYPFVNARYDFGIAIEDENGEDVDLIIDHNMAELKDLVPASIFSMVKIHLAHISSGLLLLLSRTTRNLVNDIRDRESAEFMLKSLQMVPKELGDMYEQDMNNIQLRLLELSFRMFKWTCLSVVPLSVADIQAAICIEDTDKLYCIDDLTGSKLWMKEDLLLKRMRDFSAGLLRVAMVDDAYGSDLQGVRYIVPDHGSVTEHMRSRGLASLLAKTSSETQLQADGVAGMHLSMTMDCLRYLRCEEVTSSVRSWEEVTDPLGMVRGLPPPRQLARSLPVFAEHAATQWGHHLIAAEKEGCPPNQIIHALQGLTQQHWMEVSRLERVAEMDVDGYADKYLCLVHALCANGLHKSLKVVCDGVKKDLNDERQLFADTILNVPNGAQYTPMMLAASGGHEKIVDILLSEGADPNRQNVWRGNALLTAVGEGHENIVRSLIRSPNCDHDLQTSGGNALASAARSGNMRVIKLLLRETTIGAHTLKLMLGGGVHTPLCVAMLSSTTDVVQVLLASSQIDDNVHDHLGRTIMHFAADCDSRHLDCVRMVVESGKFDLNIQDINGYSPLHSAVQEDNLKVAEMLLSTGKIDVDAGCPQGTPMHFAVDLSLPDMVRLLIDNGADVTACDITQLEKRSPIDIARGMCDEEYDGNEDHAKVLAIMEGHIKSKDSADH